MTLRSHPAGLTAAALVLSAAVSLPFAATSTRAQSAAPAAPPASAHLTTPKEEWGHDIGDDYFLVNYQQLVAYWKTLEQQSPRIHLVEIGRSSENRPMYTAVITSPGNYSKIDRYREISRRLAGADGVSDDEARALAKEGKAVVWIDGGLHATEVLGAQQLVELVWQLVSLSDEESLRFLNDDIVLCTLVNPDGMDLVSDQYMKYGSTAPPVLYNHYAGHDDNRDFYMGALAESTSINKVLYRDWFPQIVYNHHQTGPQGTVMFSAPFRDPYNYYQHPYAISAIDTVGALMQERFMMEGKAGVTERKGAPYSTWFNGGLRTTAHFHNMIGILTETIGSPTPISIPFLPAKQIPDSNLYWPIKPQEVWHFRQSIDYSITANRAILDYASRYREKLLYDIYKMGKDEIQWGSQDHWTFTPHRMAHVQDELVARGAVERRAIPGAAGGPAGRAAGAGGRAGSDPLYAALTTRELRDPRGFIISSSQPDFGTATRFVNALIKTGVTVMRATAPFAVNGKSYPANSYVVKTAQAFRPHVMDMFEPQDHPDDIPYPGGPPTPPYDATGYTLAFQMGVQFDRVLDAFDGPFETLTDFARVPAGVIRSVSAPAGYYFTHQATNSIIAVNLLLAANEDVSWLWTGPMGDGTFYVASKPTTLPLIQKAAADLGVTFQATATPPAGPLARLRPPRIGLVDHYGGGMPTGWTRLILENFEFPYDEARDDLFPPDINAGNLSARFDVLVFNSESLGGANGAACGSGASGPGRGGRGATPSAQRAPGDDRPAPLPMPEKYARRIGVLNQDGCAALRRFVEDGGTIIAIGSATTGAIQQFKLPLASHLVKTDGSPLATTEFYIPGTVLQVSLDNRNPVAHGLPGTLDIFFDNDPVWRLEPASQAGTLHPVATYTSDHPLRSGWAWGQQFLDKGIEMAEATAGKGRLFLFGNELLFRAQPHGNFTLFFNALYLSVTPDMKAGLER
jgi:hypothetical protein